MDGSFHLIWQHPDLHNLAPINDFNIQITLSGQINADFLTVTKSQIYDINKYSHLNEFQDGVVINNYDINIFNDNSTIIENFKNNN